MAWLHFVRPDVDPIGHGVSRYAGGPYGYAVTIAFALLSFAVLVSATLMEPASSGRALLVAAAGLLLVVVFPLRSPSAAGTEYILHQVGGAVFFVAGTIGVQAISRTLRAVSAPAWLQRTARASGAAAGAGVVVFFGSVAARQSLLGPSLGLFQRICFAAICTALVTLGLGLIRESPSNAGAMGSTGWPRPRGPA